MPTITEDKKKILLAIPLPPPVHGVTMINGIIKNSNSFNSRFNTRYIDYSFVSEINKIGGLSVKKGALFIKHLRSVLSKVLRFKPDAIYITIAPIGGAFLRDAVLVFLLKTFFSKKIVFHLHGKGIYQEMKKSKLLSMVYNYVFSNSEIILLSSLLMNDIKLIKTNKQVHFLPNGIYPMEEAKSENQLTSIKLLYLSNLIESKGVLILLEALNKVVKKGYRDFKINFVGKTSKSITKEIFNQEVERLKLQSFVSYLGPKYGNEKTEIFNSSDIFVFPTYKDCFPLVLLEAMQSKLAIISTNEGAIPEIIENDKTGIICEKKNIDELVAAIIRLFENPKLIKELAENGRNKYKKNYTVEVFENRLVECFDKIFQKDEFGR